MLKLGGKLTEKDNEIATLRASNAALVNDVQTCHDTPCPQAPQGGIGATGGLIVFLVGLACGMGAAFGVLWMVSK